MIQDVFFWLLKLHPGFIPITLITLHIIEFSITVYARDAAVRLMVQQLRLCPFSCMLNWIVDILVRVWRNERRLPHSTVCRRCKAWHADTSAMTNYSLCALLSCVCLLCSINSEQTEKVHLAFLKFSAWIKLLIISMWLSQHRRNSCCCCCFFLCVDD